MPLIIFLDAPYFYYAGVVGFTFSLIAYIIRKLKNVANNYEQND